MYLASLRADAEWHKQTQHFSGSHSHAQLEPSSYPVCHASLDLVDRLSKGCKNEEIVKWLVDWNGYSLRCVREIYMLSSIYKYCTNQDISSSLELLLSFVLKSAIAYIVKPGHFKALIVE